MFTWSNYSLQEANNFLMEELGHLHEVLMTMIFMILVMVLLETVAVFMSLLTNKLWVNKEKVELLWTFVPLVVLVLMVLPSLRTLYLLDEPKASMLTLKVTGHQWYWSYELINKHKTLEVDSFMALYKSCSNPFMFLEVDNRVTLPYGVNINLLVTSTDVLHSWAIPSLGLKMDAMPGRLNRLSMISSRPGTFWGQCSEICGANHSFMPIIIEFVDTNSFLASLN